MEIQCECGQFRASINNFPNETPGRLGCYCDDCQSYLIHLNRTDLLDKSGCTEVVPVYPDNLKFKEGQKHLKCIQLAEKGTYRWFAGCCNSPIANTKAAMPWVGLFAHTFVQKNPEFLEKTFGPIKSRILGKFAKGEVASNTASKMNFLAFKTVFPFILKGKIFKRHRNSPFFESDGLEPISKPHVMNSMERESLREKFNSIKSY